MGTPMAQIDQKSFIQKTPYERFRTLVRKPQEFISLLTAICAAIGAIAAITSNVATLKHGVSTLFPERAAQATSSTVPIQAVRDTLSMAIAELNMAHNQLTQSQPDLANAQERIESALSLIGEADVKLEFSAVPQKQGFDFSFVSTAYADSQSVGAALPIDAKRWLLVGVMSVLAGAFLFSILAIFRTKDPQVLQFSFDTVKTLMGFFIGVATTLIGTT
jgi:hypothetical protein